MKYLRVHVSRGQAPAAYKLPRRAGGHPQKRGWEGVLRRRLIAATGTRPRPTKLPGPSAHGKKAEEVRAGGHTHAQTLNYHTYLRVPTGRQQQLTGSWHCPVRHVNIYEQPNALAAAMEQRVSPGTRGAQQTRTKRQHWQ